MMKSRFYKKFLQRITLFVAGILVLASFATAQTTVHSFSFGGTTRSYRLHLPANYTGSAAVPLVFNLHGYTSNAMQQEFYAGMNAVSDTAGFIVCFPDGLNNSWNSGFQLPYYGGVDDVGFISVLIDSLQAGYNIDPARVYACGMSNGGFMSYRLACDLESRIAAIASVTGSMTTLQLNNCQCSRTMPVFEIHGTADATVPYNTNSLSMGIDSVMRYWRAHNACMGLALYDTLPNYNALDSSYVTRQIYGGCTDNVEVLHYKVEGGGHSWPGAIFQIPNVVTNEDINSSVEIWRFFSRFVHPNPVLTQVNAPSAHDAPVVAPNPTQGSIHVVHLQPGASLSLHDLQGKELGHWTTQTTDFTIVTEEMPVGIYFLHVVHAEGNHVLQVLKRD